MKTPVNKETISQHITYSWWKYALLIILAVFATDLLYTVTAYRSPENKKVQFYIYGYANTEGLDAYMAKIQEEQMPDMEVMNCQTIIADDSYGVMQLTTYMAAGEGDIYLLPRDQFISSAGSGAFLPLEDDIELMTIFDGAGISLQNGWRRDSSTGETHLFGIPQSKLPGLTASYAYAEDGYLSVLTTNQNDENVLKFLRILCQDMLTAPEEESPETGVAETETASEPAPEASENPAETASEADAAGNP